MIFSGNTVVRLRALLVGMICCFAIGCGQPETAGYSQFSEANIKHSEKTPSHKADVNGDSPEVVKTPNQVALSSSPDQIVVHPSMAVKANSTTLMNDSVASGRSRGNDSGTRTRVTVLVKSRDFKIEGPERAMRVNYDDIDLSKVLNIDLVTADVPKLMPQWLKDLHGKRIRIRGFMYPPFQETEISQFVLARDNQICCFGRSPKIYDVFPVLMRKGTTTNYISNRPFDVVGVFHIKAEVEDGELFGLYAIKDAIVVEKW